MSVNINGKVMKKILIFSLIFLGTLKAVEMAVKTPAGPAEDSEWSISFNELEKSYNQAKVRGVPSLVDLAAKRIADTVSICDPAIQDLPWELINLVAQQWYKKNATRINNLALEQKIPSIKLTGHNGWIYAIAILQNGDIVTESWDGTAIIWDPETGKEKQKLEGHDNGVKSIAILPNGDVVTGSWDGTARIWDAVTGKEKQQLTFHNSSITSIAILPNGDVVTGFYDGTARIWNPEAGKDNLKLVGHNSAIFSIAISPNGDIVTGSDDTTARIWKISENIKKLFGDNLNNLTLESLCLAEKKFNLMRRPQSSNPSCVLI